MQHLLFRFWDKVCANVVNISLRFYFHVYKDNMQINLIKVIRYLGQ